MFWNWGKAGSRLDRRSVIFGSGIGVVIVTFVFFIALRLSAPAPLTIIAPGDVSDDYVIERAGRLGMITLRELPEGDNRPDGDLEELVFLLEQRNVELLEMIASITADEYEQPDEYDEGGGAQNYAPDDALNETAQDAAAGETVQTPAAAPAPTPAPPASPQPTPPALPPAPPPPAPPAPPPPSPPPTPPPPVMPEPDIEPDTEPDTGTEPASEPDMDGYNRIIIPQGHNAVEVSVLLFLTGLVDSAIEFNNFVTANDMAARISPGTHIIPDGASHEEILAIISSRAE